MASLSLLPSVIEGIFPMIYEDPGVNPFTVLVVGLDRKIEGTVRTDVIMLVFVDSERGWIKVSSIPRDLVYGRGKINAVYGKYGIEGLKKAVMDLTGIEVNGYAVFDYESFKILGDELGPITVEIKSPMIYHDYAQDLDIEFKPGVYKLKGDRLLAYIRYRKGGMGDLDRIERQKYVMMKLLKKALSGGVDVVTGVYTKLMEYVDTDLKIGVLVYFFLKFKNGLNVSFIRFPYTVLSDGSVVLDRTGMGDFKRELFTESSGGVREYRFLVLNNSSNPSPIFLDRTASVWKERYGKPPQEIFWRRLESYPEGDHLIILSGDVEKISGIAKKVYPNREFEVHRPGDIETSRIYYGIISSLSKARMYPPLPLDAVFLVGDVR